MQRVVQAVRKAIWSAPAIAAASLLIAAFVLPPAAHAQDFNDSSKWELGGHFAVLNLPSQCASLASCDESNNGLGANLTYNFSRWASFDSEMNFFGDSGNASTSLTGGHVTEGLFGIRFGPTTRRWGFYSELRPGFANFSRVLGGSSPLGMDAGGGFASHPFTAKLAYDAASGATSPLAVAGFARATYFAFNYGEAIEYRPTKHFALRFDIGDTMISYPGSNFGIPFHQHNFQLSQAFVVRF